MNTNIMESIQTQEPELVKLPLWKSCYEAMIEGGVDYGKVYETKWFEEFLKAPADTMSFGLDVSRINRALQFHGFHMTSRGQKGALYVIVQAEANRCVMENYQHQAMDAFKRALVLGTNTRTDMMKEEDRRRHEGTLERIANKLAMLQRRQPVQSKETARNLNLASV